MAPRKRPPKRTRASGSGKRSASKAKAAKRTRASGGRSGSRRRSASASSKGAAARRALRTQTPRPRRHDVCLADNPSVCEPHYAVLVNDRELAQLRKMSVWKGMKPTVRKLGNGKWEPSALPAFGEVDDAKAAFETFPPSMQKAMMLVLAANAKFLRGEALLRTAKYYLDKPTYKREHDAAVFFLKTEPIVNQFDIQRAHNDQLSKGTKADLLMGILASTQGFRHAITLATAKQMPTTNKESEDKLAQCQEGLDAARRADKACNKTLEETKGHLEACATLNKKCTEDTKRLEKLVKEKEDETGKVQKAAQEVRAKNKELQTKIEDATKSLDECAKERAKFSTQLEDARAANQSLRKQLSAL